MTFQITHNTRCFQSIERAQKLLAQKKKEGYTIADILDRESGFCTIIMQKGEKC